MEGVGVARAVVVFHVVSPFDHAVKLVVSENRRVENFGQFLFLLVSENSCSWVLNGDCDNLVLTVSLVLTIRF